MLIHTQTKRLVKLLEDEEFSTDVDLYASNLPYTHLKLIDSLNNIEESLSVVEIESRSWHDFWVVQRAICRALYVILIWIIKKDKTAK